MTCFAQSGHHQMLKVVGEETALFLRWCLVDMWFPQCTCVSVTSVNSSIRIYVCEVFLYNFTCLCTYIPPCCVMYPIKLCSFSCFQLLPELDWFLFLWCLFVAIWCSVLIFSRILGYRCQCMCRSCVVLLYLFYIYIYMAFFQCIYMSSFFLCFYNFHGVSYASICMSCM
jgi:hypothetical protein